MQCSSTASLVYIINFDKTLKILKANFWLKLIIAILCNQRGGVWIVSREMGGCEWPGLD